MSGTDVSLTDLLEQVIGEALRRMMGPVVGQIESYDAPSGRASVTPLVPLLVAGTVIPPPTLQSVPVAWPASSAHSVKFPLGAGVLVTLAPLGHDHDEWLTSGTPNVTPKSERRFSLADLVAYPVAPLPLASSPDPLSYDPSWAVLLGRWAVGGSDATKAAALDGDETHKTSGSVFAAWMTQVETAINTLAPGSITPLSTTFTQLGTVVATATELKAK